MSCWLWFTKLYELYEFLGQMELASKNGPVEGSEGSANFSLLTKIPLIRFY